MDIGHYFVDSVKNWLRVSQKWTLNVKAQAYKQKQNCKCRDTMEINTETKTEIDMSN